MLSLSLFPLLTTSGQIYKRYYISLNTVFFFPADQIIPTNLQTKIYKSEKLL